MMETNAGTKLITEKADIPGYGAVWFDSGAVSNLFLLSEIVKRGHRVRFDSSVANEFVVETPEERKRKELIRKEIERSNKQAARRAKDYEFFKKKNAEESCNGNAQLLQGPHSIQ